MAIQIFTNVLFQPYWMLLVEKVCGPQMPQTILFEHRCTKETLTFWFPFFLLPCIYPFPLWDDGGGLNSITRPQPATKFYA